MTPVFFVGMKRPRGRYRRRSRHRSGASEGNAVAFILTVMVVSAFVYPRVFLCALVSLALVATLVLVGWLLLKVRRHRRCMACAAVGNSARDSMAAPVCPKAFPDAGDKDENRPVDVCATARKDFSEPAPVSFFPPRLSSESERRGMAGERRVREHLRTLPHGYIVLNDIMLPAADGTTTQIDHIVVSECGIFVLETKSYSGWVFGDAKRREWVQTLPQGRHGAKKSHFQNPIRQNWRHICALADNLGIPKDYFKSVVVFTEGCAFKSEMPPNVVVADGIVGYIASFTEKIIKERQLEEIASAIREWESVLPDDARAAHVANLRRLHSRKAGQ